MSFFLSISIIIAVVIRFNYYIKELNRETDKRKKNDVKIEKYNKEIEKHKNDLQEYRKQLKKYDEINEFNKSIELEIQEVQFQLNDVNKKLAKIKPLDLEELLNDADESYEYRFIRKPPNNGLLNSLKKEEIFVNKTVSVNCPNCGNKYLHILNANGKNSGLLSGATAGAILGSKIGIAMGPLGAISGLIPGAILGSVFGKDLGKIFDNPICPQCKTTFELPNNMK